MMVVYKYYWDNNYDEKNFQFYYCIINYYNS